MKKNSEYEFMNLLGKFFTEYLPKSMNASKNTIKSYKCTFRLLFNYLNEETDIEVDTVRFDSSDARQSAAVMAALIHFKLL